MSHPAIEPDRVKKSKSRFEAERKIPSESEGKSSDFARYGMVVTKIYLPFSETSIKGPIPSPISAISTILHRVHRP